MVKKKYNTIIYKYWNWRRTKKIPDSTKKELQVLKAKSASDQKEVEKSKNVNSDVYNEIIKIVAKRNNIGWVDNARLIPHESEYFVDRVHFASKGAARMAENLLPAVLAQLRP